MNYRFISAETGASLGAANQTKPNQNPNRGEEASPLTKRGYSLPITSRGRSVCRIGSVPRRLEAFFIEILTSVSSIGKLSFSVAQNGYMPAHAVAQYGESCSVWPSDAHYGEFPFGEGWCSPQERWRRAL